MTMILSAIVLSAVIAVSTPSPKKLDAAAYMQSVFVEVERLGASETQISRLKRIAKRESRNSPTACGRKGCGAFQIRIRPLLKEYGKDTPAIRKQVRWRLTHEPAYTAATALDILSRCENLCGPYWNCCYGGAYRPACRKKWDKKFRDRFHRPIPQPLT